MHIRLQKKKKKSYVWIDSIFEAQNICFGSEIAGLLDHSSNKHALTVRILLFLINHSSNNFKLRVRNFV